MMCLVTRMPVHRRARDLCYHMMLHWCQLRPIAERPLRCTPTDAYRLIPILTLPVQRSSAARSRTNRGDTTTVFESSNGQTSSSLGSRPSLLAKDVFCPTLQQSGHSNRPPCKVCCCSSQSPVDDSYCVTSRSQPYHRCSRGDEESFHWVLPFCVPLRDERTARPFLAF